MNTITRTVAALLLVALMGASALGCNTLRGVGKDVEHTGDHIQNAVDDTQNNR